MGQAVIDLPDPLEQPPAGASADDLLSQLAGDEIDRLLGEAEDPPESAAEVASAADTTGAVVEAVDPPAVKPALPPVPSGELDQAIAAHADAVLGPSATPAEPVARPEPLATEPERDALLALAADAVEDDEPASLPLLLRPLEWLSSPLENLSPAARDLLGKAAIVTLVNSAAVIAYVLWFRR
jgi:hypothetical protein